MSIELGEYIMDKLGDKVYDELEIDPSDYNKLPAYEFYDEVISSCRILRPEIITKYYDEMQMANCPTTEKEFRDYQNSKIKNNFALALQMTLDIIVHTGKYRLSKPDYSNIRYYSETLLNFIKGKDPAEIEEYLLDHSKENLPKSNINCNRMRQFIIYLAQKYKGQYGFKR